MANRKAPRTDPHQVNPESEAWNMLPWRKLEQHVYRIQKRIYRANQRGETRTVQKLQKLLTKSKAARYLAVRRVTQDNQGKKTAGVDGVKSVPPKQRLAMVESIHPKYWKHSKPKPVRRVWIPKPGKDERRPLGIPTMLERAKQALGKMTLEPEWEAVFEPNSYGFRPGRSCHDAIEMIFLSIKHKPKYVYDADIKGCFDNINQEALLQKLHTYSAMRQAVKGWLNAGVLEGEVFTPTEAGTPQGGVISPLLANIALHGMERVIKEGYYTSRSANELPILIRYADDFIILHSQREAVDKAAEKVTEWLEGMGLHMSPTKTRVTHTLKPMNGNMGFDFLGFTIRQYPVGKTHTGEVANRWSRKKLGFKTNITPSKEGVKGHTQDIKQRLRKLTNRTQAEVIRDLNPVIHGWSNYYKAVVSSKVFNRCDKTLYVQLTRWAIRKHPTRGKRWLQKKYWHTVGKRHWVFTTPEGATIRRHSMTKIQHYTKVKGAASPYDGNLLYWSKRLRNHPVASGTLGKLLHKQQGKCRWCELAFRDGDLIEIDHIDQNSSNNALSNKMALHRHCHDDRHAKYGAAKEKFERLTGMPRKQPKWKDQSTKESQEPWDEQELQTQVKQDIAKLKKLRDEGINIR